MLAMVLSIKMYPILVSTFAFHGAVYTYTAVAVVMTLWAAIMVRSTDGLSVVDVENMYNDVKTISVGINSSSHVENHATSTVMHPSPQQHQNQQGEGHG